ncbi:MAG: hypothetical protein NTW50_05050 [Candidatus Berkelbacteria bacterium]|nr:hypothetical protein [Candidatus Berkelbacteria bacterium]
MRVHYLLSLIAMSVLLLCTVSTQAKPPTKKALGPKATIPADWIVRQDMKKRIVSLLDLLVKASKYDAEMTEVADFFKASAKLVKPFLLPDEKKNPGFGCQFLDHGNSSTGKIFLFVPLLPGDEKAGVCWHDYIKSLRGHAFAAYNSDRNILTVSDVSDKCSDLWLAIYFASMIKQTEINLLAIKSGGAPFYECERKSYDFQNHLLSRIFGSEYDDYIIFEAGLMTDKLTALNMLNRGWIPVSDLEPLPEILGKMKSPIEHDIVMNVLWINVIYKMIESQKGMRDDEIVNQKENFILLRYKENGLDFP